MGRLMRFLILLAAATAIAGLAAFLVLERYLDTALPVDDAVFYEIPAGRALGVVARDLASEGLLERPRLFVLHARLSGRASSVKAGEYRIEAGETARSLLDRFVRGDVHLHSVTVIEGWTYRQLVERLGQETALTGKLADMDDVAIADRIGLPTASLEGWFFPDTYLFERGTAETEILRRGYEEISRQLEELWAGRADDLPLETPYEALILASIVERETALDEERPRIAGVFIRRLRKGMRLQTDPTVIYGLGASFDGNLRRKDLERDTPYNTYTRQGLPPTPIALPGRASLQAVVHPSDDDSLYFVATGDPDGSHYFSATLEEHNRAVERYLERLREAGD